MAVKNLREEIEAEKLRDEHNKDLIRRMRNGEPLTSFDSHSSWFPPRPTIEKDSNAISQLYGETTEAKSDKKHGARVLKLAK